jgi:hypothetical protein
MIFADARRKQDSKAGWRQLLSNNYVSVLRMGIHRNDPLSNWEGNDGAEIHCKLFRLNCSLSQYTTQLDVEIAINIALIQQFVWRRCCFQKEKFAKYSHYSHFHVREQHKFRRTLSSGVCHRIVHWKWNDVSEEHVTSNFTIDEWTKQETNAKWTASRALKVIALNVVESGQLGWWTENNDVSKTEHCREPLQSND